MSDTVLTAQSLMEIMMSNQKELEPVKATLSSGFRIKTDREGLTDVEIDSDGQINIDGGAFLWPAEFELLLERGAELLEEAKAVEAECLERQNARKADAEAA